MKQAVILAGGKGTRLKSELGNLPKALVDIGGKPLLELQIFQLKKYGFSNIILLLNHESSQIIEFCKSNNNWDLDIQFIIEKYPMGTAGAVINAFEVLKDDFLIVYGDTLFDIDIEKFYKFHIKDTNTTATLFLHPNDHPHDSDLVEIDNNNRITFFYPYPHDKNKFFRNLVNAAFYFINKKSLIKWKNNKQMLDFGKDIFPSLLLDNQILMGYNSPEYIKDCGTPKRIKSVRKHYSSMNLKSDSNKSKAIFLDRDGTIIKHVKHLNHHKQLELIKDSAKAIKNINKSEFLSCVITNQPVIARGDCSIEELNTIHNKMESDLGKEGSYLDRIYYCPHYPEKGFAGEVVNLKIDCNCRKPKTGLISKCVNDLNINLKLSWFVGDSTTDIMCAKNAEINSVLVNTGLSGMDYKYLVNPDYSFNNLNTTVNFILKIYPKIYSLIEKLNFKKKIFFIGGKSKSGKTTFSNVIKNYFNNKNLVCHIISLDNWLKNFGDRGNNVIERYSISAINNIISKISKIKNKPIKVYIPFYNKFKKVNIKTDDFLIIKPTDIVIFEGVIALNLISKRNYLHEYLYIKIDENLRKQRFIDEYISRGLKSIEIEKLYNSRELDEIPFIESSILDSRIINLDII